MEILSAVPGLLALVLAYWAFVFFRYVWRGIVKGYRDSRATPADKMAAYNSLARALHAEEERRRTSEAARKSPTG